MLVTMVTRQWGQPWSQPDTDHLMRQLALRKKVKVLRSAVLIPELSLVTSQPHDLDKSHFPELQILQL